MRWLADENLNYDIVRAVRRLMPEIDIVRAQDVGLSSVDDPAVLAWAAADGRVLLTHDVATITAHAYERLARGETMPGVFEVGCDVPIRSVVDDIMLLTECSEPGEWEGQVVYLPLRSRKRD